MIMPNPVILSGLVQDREQRLNPAAGLRARPPRAFFGFASAVR